VQQAIVPLSAFERQAIEASLRRAEEVGRSPDIAPVATAPEAGAPVPETPEPAVAAHPDPLGDLISAILSDTPESAPREGEDAQNAAIARPPALAFGGEPSADRSTQAAAGQRTAATPAPTDAAPAAPHATSPDADNERIDAAATEPTGVSAKTDDAPKAKQRRIAARPATKPAAKPALARKAAVARPAIRKKARIVRAARRARRADVRSAAQETTQDFLGQTPVTYNVEPQSYPSYYGTSQTRTKAR
jgi:hypothetical protein